VAYARPVAHNEERGFLSTWTGRIVAMNIGVYLMQMWAPGITNLGAKIDPLIRRGEYYRLLTPVLLHASPGHLFANSYSLNNVGYSVESLFGSRSFLALYLFSGISGNVLSYVARTAPMSIGASTAVSGVVGALFFFCMRHRHLHNDLTRQIQDIGQVVAFNAFMGLTNKRIDNMGHLGGFLGGMAYSFFCGPRLVPVVTPFGKSVLRNRPLLQTWWSEGTAAFRKVGYRQPPPPPRVPPRPQRSRFLPGPWGRRS
jgi:membrane associated rhomboid family serine protease